MQEQLFIRLPASSAQGNEPIIWFICQGAQAEVLASGELESAEQLSQLRQQAQRCHTTVVLPGQDVVTKSVALPAGTKRHLDRVIPYALEEELATDIDQLHFSWPTDNARAGQPLPVAVVADTCMKQWQQWLNEAGIEADSWCPDYLLLPYQEQQWSVMQLANSVVVRYGQWQGMAIELAQFEETAKLLPTDTPPTQINHFGELQWQQPPAPLSAADIEVPMSVLASVVPPFDVRRGQYRAVRKNTVSVNWRPLAIAASVAFVLLVGGNLLRAWQLNSQAENMQQQAEQLYKDTFPGQTRIVNLRVQLRRQLEQVGASEGEQQSALALLAALQPAFAQQPQMRLELLRFQQGELRLQALANNFSQFEQFQRQAEQAGLTVEQGALNNRGDQVAGTLTIVRANRGGASS